MTTESIINLLIHTVTDPLEQFTVHQFVESEPVETPHLYLYSDTCAFNIITIFNNLWLITIYIWEIAYKTLYQNVLIYIISPIHIVLLWCLLGFIATFTITFDKVNSTYPKFNQDEKKNFGKNSFFIHYLNKTFFSIVKSIIKSNTTLKKKEYFNVLYFLFLFILLCNLFGLIPYTFTITSSFIATFFLAATHFIALNIIAIYKNKWNFINLFLPAGVPIFIAPILVLIELVSYIAKVFSLSIRLFANMMSGHALLKILIGFSWSMLTISGGMFYGIALLPWIIVSVILFLELLIAFLQAYVFVVLIAIYISDVLNMH